MRSAQRHTLEEYLNGIQKQDRWLLSKAFTLLESDLTDDKLLKEGLLKAILPLSGNAKRIAITGTPGVGKSTFIETLGVALCNKGEKVAVLTIDPSSQHTGGSILGDKTRMEKLAQHSLAFIRPTASRATLGGTAAATREGILLCEAAGFDIIIVETVGVGQSETLAAQMTDVFLVLLEPGAGDDIQAIKKGIMEEADIIAVTKADLDKQKALHTSIAYLAEVRGTTWKQPTLTISCLVEKDVLSVWKTIDDFLSFMETHDHFNKKRATQRIFWLHETLKKTILDDLYNHKEIEDFITSLEEGIKTLKISPFEASRMIIERYKAI